jgi:hypothetical protein
VLPAQTLALGNWQLHGVITQFLQLSVKETILEMTLKATAPGCMPGLVRTHQGEKFELFVHCLSEHCFRVVVLCLAGRDKQRVTVHLHPSNKAIKPLFPQTPKSFLHSLHQECLKSKDSDQGLL